MSAPDLLLLREVEQFIFREARLQDEHEYDAWEALWTDDGVYWIPANGDDIDPDQQMSIIYDNRSRIALRIKQFHTGKRHSQTPRSRLRRVVSNIEIAAEEGADIRVLANSLIFESNPRADTIWGAQTEYVLRRDESGLRMAKKKVMLVNNDKALYTMSFLV
jgi:3-phenylpropionate/cinnamic acid dioxygenase small subunit